MVLNTGWTPSPRGFASLFFQTAPSALTRKISMAVPAQNFLVGMGFMITATIFWSGLDASAKYLVDLRGMPPLLVVWVRLSAGLVTSYFLGALMERRWDIWRVNRPLGQFWRSFCMAGTTVCNFTALGHLPVTTTISIFFAAPLIIAALSQFVLGERVGRMRWTAILVGFCGIGVIMQPWGDGFSPWMLCSVGAATFFALMQLSTRQLAGHDSAGSAVFYTTAVGAIALTPVIFFVDGQLVGPGNNAGWALLILVGGIFGTGGHVFNVLAMHYAGPVRVAPFFFFSIIWMIIFQTLFFGGNIDPLTLVGASIVIASGLFVFWREARASRLERGRG